RGSKPTMSKRWRNRVVNTSGYAFTTWALGQPGPPQLNSTVPTRRVGSVAGSLLKARITFAPWGRDQSIGTLSVAHCTAGTSTQGPQSSRGAAAAPPTPAAANGTDIPADAAQANTTKIATRQPK